MGIELFDAHFIAGHILQKLEIKPKQIEVVRAPHALRRTLRSIERMEPNWSYTAPIEGHSFGRKHTGEPIGLWSVPTKSAMVLENLVRMTNAKTILEIGTSAGYAALHLAAGALTTAGSVYTIELLPAKLELAEKHFREAGVRNINLISGEASEVLKSWSHDLIDFIFLDADKENYGKYLDLLLPHMRSNTLIVADNINDYGHMMEDYLQRVTGTHLPNSRCDRRVKSYYLAALDNGLMITKKL